MPTISTSYSAREPAGESGHAWGSRWLECVCASDDQRSAEVGRRLGADMFDAALPVCAEIIIAQAVVLRLDQPFKRRLQRRSLRGVDFDLEYRILDPLSKIAANFRDPTQASRAAGITRPNIIGHQNKHGHSSFEAVDLRNRSFPKPGRIGVEIAAQVPRQQLRQMGMGSSAETSSIAHRPFRPVRGRRCRPAGLPDRLRSHNRKIAAPAADYPAERYRDRRDRRRICGAP